MAHVLIFGANGQVGRELLATEWPAGIGVSGKDRGVVDITDASAVEACVLAHRSRVIINAAAYTAVDRAENDVDAAFAVNARGAETLAAVARRHGAALIHFSTDYVFDGSASAPYRESDAAAPLNVYGASKLAGEERIRSQIEHHLIIRTSWVFSPFGANFVKTMLRLGAERPAIQIVDDQVGCPTAASDIAAAVVLMVARLMNDKDVPWGTFHFCGAPAVSWHDFAAAIFQAVGAGGRSSPRLIPVPSAAYPTPARRPANSVLNCSRITEAFGIPQPDWRASLLKTIRAVSP